MSGDNLEDRLRRAMHERADGIVPDQPDWADLVSAPPPPRRRRNRYTWLALGTAALAIVVAVALFGYANRASHVQVSGASGTGAPTAAPASTVGPPDTPLPPGFVPASITRISLHVGWVLGIVPCGPDTCAALARTRDAGASWHAVPVPPIAVSGTVASHVRFADETNGWIFGPQAWSTHDAGMTWHTVPGLGGPVASLEAANGIVWGLVGSPGATATVFASPVARDDWKLVGPEAVSPGAGISLHGASGFVAGTDGTVIALVAGGLDRRGTACSGAALSAVAAATDTDLAALCVSDPAAGSSTKTVALSHDGGRTWTTGGTTPRGGQPQGLAASSARTYVVAAASGASYLYRTTDGGRTWATVFTDAGGGAPFADLGFTNPNHGVVILDAARASKLLVTSDAGATWSAQTFTP